LIQPEGIQIMDEFALVPNNSLITATPEEGRQLAVKIARLIIKLTQPDEEKRKQLLDVWQRCHDADCRWTNGCNWICNNRCCKPLLEEVRCDGWILSGGLWFSQSVRSAVNLAANLSDHLLQYGWGTVKVQDQIVDVYAANKTHFLRLKDGTEIRLDRLISVDGKPTFGSDYGNFCSQPPSQSFKACYCRWNGRKHHYCK